MKRWFLYLCLAMFPVFLACSDDKEGEEGEKITLTVDQEKLEFEAGKTESMMERIRVTTNAEAWTVVAEIEGDDKWFSATKMDHQWVEVVASVNNFLEKKEGKILIKAEGCPDKEVPVLQSAAAEATLELSKEVIVFDKEGGDEKVIITSNQATICLDGVEDADWFDVNLAEDNKSFTVAVKKNTESELYATTFKVIAGIEGNQKEIDVVVRQVDAVVLNASGYRVVLNAPDGMTTVKTSETWCAAELKEGKLLIGASGNVGGSGRSATVTVGENIVINVEQEGGEFKSGDVFKHNGVAVGIVVSHDADGLLVLSLEEKTTKWATGGHTLTTDRFNSAYVKAREQYPDDWKEKFPAFAYCAEMDNGTGMEGWCLPVFWQANEKDFFGDPLTGYGENPNSEWAKLAQIIDVVDAALETLGKPKYCEQPMKRYWTSTSYAVTEVSWVYACYWPLQNTFTTGTSASNESIARCFWWKHDLVK